MRKKGRKRRNNKRGDGEVRTEFEDEGEEVIRGGILKRRDEVKGPNALKLLSNDLAAN